MKKIFLAIILVAAAVLSACSNFDDSALRDRIDDFKKRIEALQSKAGDLEAQIRDLSLLTNGNVITSVTQDSDGRYVVTYKDDDDVEHSVVLATTEDILDVPVLGVQLDEEEGIYYWTQYLDGRSEWLCRENGERIPVRGNTPLLAVDDEGYWTVDGARIFDAENRPVAANDERSSLFRAASCENGIFTLTLGNGEVLSFRVFDTLNLKLSVAATVTVVDAAAGSEIVYELSGEAADRALVSVALAAGGAEATLDRENRKVSVRFNGDFSTASNARVILMAYDLADNVVVKPVFFRPADTDRVEIATAAGLLQFAAEVNGGGFPDGMQVVLTDDIDMKEVQAWTPVGNGTFNGTAITGARFSGTFDGQGHTIDHLVVVDDAVAANGVVGLFGCIENATVKNVVLGNGCSFSAKSTGFLHVGGIVAAAVASTVESCDNYAAISVESGVKNQRVVAGGVVGATFAGAGAQVSNCRNYGAMSSANTLSDNNGANGIQIAGILGFANSTANDGVTTVSKCENRGELNVQAARAAGIVGALNYTCDIVDCHNEAAITNTDVTASNSRTGGIAGLMNNTSNIAGCVNTGDVTFAVAGDTTHGYAAGIVSQIQTANCSVTDCTNYGRVRSDIIKTETATSRYIAIIAANTNKTACRIADCKVGGKIGPYTEDGTYSVTEITADNYADYIWFSNDLTQTPDLENNLFAGEASSDTKGIRTVADLLAFRDAVNAGASTAEWEDESGVVHLLADLDLASVGVWTPIGNASIASGSFSPVTVKGNAFTGKFDGYGHTLKNVELTTAATDSEAVYGLFGVLKNAEVSNLTLGAASGDATALKVNTAASVWTGSLAGVVIDSKVADCTSYAPIEYDSGTAPASRSAVGMMALVTSSDASSYLDNCKNYGKITVDVHGSTSNGWANAPHIGGICAIATSNTETKQVNHIDYCANYGDLESNSARTAGIVAAANNYTEFNSCVNYGTQTNSIGANGRLGGITVLMGTGCAMTDCINYGDVISTSADGARVGGLLSLPNHATNSFSGCANYGKVISNSQYRGVFWGYCNMNVNWVNCLAAGITGVWNDGTVIHDQLPDEESYLGPVGATAPNLSNITYQIGTTDGSGSEPSQGPEPELRILCIGNSFTKDAVEHLPKMIAAAGIETVKIVHVYYGGRTIPEYASGYSTTKDYTCYMFNTGTDLWLSYANWSIEQAVKSDRWDIVTIQEHTGNYRAWSWTEEEKLAVTGLIDAIKKDQGDHLPSFKYIMSQAYYDMGKIGSGSKPYITWTTQAEMFDVIVEQGKKVLAETDIDAILPTGTTLQNLRTSSLDNAMNLTRDGYHMDYGISRYAAACTLFEMLITPKYDITLDDNAFRYTVSNTAEGSYSTPVTDENRTVALQAARYAIAKPFEVTDISIRR